MTFPFLTFPVSVKLPFAVGVPESDVPFRRIELTLMPGGMAPVNWIPLSAFAESETSNEACSPLINRYVVGEVRTGELLGRKI